MEISKQLRNMFAMAKDTQIANKMFKLHIPRADMMLVSELIDAEIERQEPCDACNNGDHGMKFKIDIEFGKRLSLNFHYCPTCGRKLRGDE